MSEKPTIAVNTQYWPRIGAYRKVPVTVEAAQWDGSVECASDLIDWMLDNGGSASYRDPDEPGGLCISILTLEGRMRADVNDWIIRGVKGEFYPCKPDIFAVTYEPL